MCPDHQHRRQHARLFLWNSPQNNPIFPPSLNKTAGRNDGMVTKSPVVVKLYLFIYLYVFIYGLFNDAVSNSEYTASNCRMIYE
jgi:hypothetical protein